MMIMTITIMIIITVIVIMQHLLEQSALGCSEVRICFGKRQDGIP